MTTKKKGAIVVTLRSRPAKSEEDKTMMDSRLEILEKELVGMRTSIEVMRLQTHEQQKTM